MIGPHSKKMAEEQARLDKKTGKKAEATITTPKEKKVDRKLMSVLLTVIGVIILIFGLYASKLENPSLAGVASWGPSRWLWILILGGIAAALIGINAKELGKAAGVLQTIVVVTVVMLIIGFPIINWFATPSSSGNSGSAAKQPSVPLASAPLSEWKPITLPPRGQVDLSIPEGKRAMVSGSKLRTHAVYQDGHECVRASEGEGSDTVCPDTPPAIRAYVTNESDEINNISYALSN
ncbi:MAG: hypothetical protein WCS97_00050 [Candidatus Paceibacterota bacterium]|jgi:hypothetical protein